MASSRATAFLAASMLACEAAADFIGWTATVRPVDNGYLVNVFAVTNDPGDVIVSISGGQEGFVRVINIPGGFRQGTDAGGVFRPTSGQSWSTPDSFLTVGGGFDASTGAWTGNLLTEGDPPWVVTYNDTQIGGPVTVNGFNTWSNSTGFANPYLNVVPPTGGWYIAGVTSPARSLAPLQGIRLPFQSIDGVAYGASSPAAASGSHGFLVGQLWVPFLTDVGAGGSLIEWRMRAFVRRPNGTINSGDVAFRIKGTMNPDADGDGVPNFEDQCPSQPGPCNGCPVNACGNCSPIADSDGDGRLDCEDNCPSVPNPSQADCDGDGVGDACEGAADCNSNGVPDSCEIAGGSAPDCNGNGIPDGCDLANGTSTDVDGNGIPDDCKPDCNGNLLPDPWEIATGRVPDCNGDLIPDTCQGAVAVDSASPNLGAPSGAEAREWVFGSLPVAATGASLTIDVRGDLDGQTEFVDVSVNGGSPRRFFAADGADCPEIPNRATWTWTAQQFTELVSATGSLTVRMTCPATVDGSECKGSGLTTFRLAYFGIGPNGDCNGNGGLDICDVAGGTPDCNGNRVPDSCDIASGLLPDCNGNGIPDSCDIGSDPTIDCNANGKPDSCDIAAGGLAVDCDSDGRIDSCQVLENPAVDCNANGKPDSCDIAAGRSLDIDANGRPDECQTVRVPLEFPTIQSAIDSAPSDQMRIILLSPGTYQGPIDLSGKSVIVRGSEAASTFIQGTGTAKSAVVRFSGGESAIAALERVTVRGGLTGTQPHGLPYFGGGGIYGRQSAANIRQCIVEGNAAGIGGGIYLENCQSTVVQTVVRANVASSDGGGITTVGGAVRLTDCTIESNDCGGRGAGAHLRGGTPTLVRTAVRGNEGATVAAGIAWIPGVAGNDFLVVDDCDITGNTAGVAQGGIGIQGSGGTPRVSLRDSTVCGNVPSPNIFGQWSDLGGNTVCTCLGNLDGDERVSGDDLGILLGSWGPCLGAPCEADLNGDSTVDGDDLGLMLGNWGPCAP